MLHFGRGYRRRSLTQHTLFQRALQHYVPFAPANLFTINLRAFSSPALPTPIRGSERRSLRVALPPKCVQSSERGIEKLISLTLQISASKP